MFDLVIFSRTQMQSQYDRLQYSFMGATSAYVDQVRKIAEVQPSKPIVPDMCIEHVWTENVMNKYFNRDESLSVHCEN